MPAVNTIEYKFTITDSRGTTVICTGTAPPLASAANWQLSDPNWVNGISGTLVYPLVGCKLELKHTGTGTVSYGNSKWGFVTAT